MPRTKNLKKQIENITHKFASSLTREVKTHVAKELAARTAKTTPKTTKTSKKTQRTAKAPKTTKKTTKTTKKAAKLVVIQTPTSAPEGTSKTNNQSVNATPTA